MNNEIDGNLQEIALLRSKRDALDKLLDECYRIVESQMKKQGLTKYTLDGVTARLKRTSQMELVNPEKLLEQVTDPVQFARVLLDTISIPQKVVKALEPYGVASLFAKKEGREFLEVNTKAAKMEEAQAASMKEYLQDVVSLRKEMGSLMVSKGCALLMKPILPVEREEVEDAG